MRREKYIFLSANDFSFLLSVINYYEGGICVYNNNIFIK